MTYKKWNENATFQMSKFPPAKTVKIFQNFPILNLDVHHKKQQKHNSNSSFSFEVTPRLVVFCILCVWAASIDILIWSLTMCQIHLPCLQYYSLLALALACSEVTHSHWFMSSIVFSLILELLLKYFCNTLELL